MSLLSHEKKNIEQVEKEKDNDKGEKEENKKCSDTICINQILFYTTRSPHFKTSSRSRLENFLVWTRLCARKMHGDSMLLAIMPLILGS